MVLPLTPDNPPTSRDFKFIVLSLTLMMAGSIPYAVVYAWIVDISWVDIAIPAILRAFGISFLVLALGKLFETSNHILLNGVSAWVFVLYIVRQVILNGQLAPHSFPTFAGDLLMKTLIVALGYLIPYWFGFVSSAYGLMYCGVISGLAFGGLENLSSTVDLLSRINQQGAAESLRYLAWANFLWSLLVQCALALIGSAFLASVESGLYGGGKLLYVNVVANPMLLLATYDGVRLLADYREDDQLDYLLSL